MEVETHILENGIRLVHKRIQSPIAHCGIIINTGSRDELPEEQGLAHLIEHLLFKGTQKRKAYHILSRMEDVGSEINAYTTKEETCIHQSFFRQYYERALELMSDIVFNSVFPDREIEKEKEVILDEINSYKDSPSELIFDEFEELLFEGNPIGRNILGTETMLKKFTREDVLRFYSSNYFTNEMVISSVGNIPFSRLVILAERYFGGIPEKISGRKESYKNTYTPFNLLKKKNTYQLHCLVGTQAYSVRNNKRYALYLLNNLLGGPGLNSRLNMSLREKKGFAYNVDSTYTAYSDTGIINIYFGSDEKDLKKSLRSIVAELETIKNKPLGKLQLAKAKRQLTGQIAISSENNENLMLTMAKSTLLFNKVDSLEEITARIGSISSAEIREVASEIFGTEKLSYLVYI